MFVACARSQPPPHQTLPRTHAFLELPSGIYNPIGMEMPTVLSHFTLTFAK